MPDKLIATFHKWLGQSWVNRSKSGNLRVKTRKSEQICEVLPHLRHVSDHLFQEKATIYLQTKTHGYRMDSVKEVHFTLKKPTSSESYFDSLTQTLALAIVLLFSCAPILAAQTPGSLDLRQHKWNQGVVHKLDGEWIWAKDEWLTAEELEALPLSQRRYTSVPGFWNETEEDTSAFGYGTLAIRLYLPKDQPFHLQLSDVGSAYKLYADTQLVSQVGSPSRYAEHEEAMFQPRLAEIRSLGQPMWLILHISNNEYKQIGVRRSIHITDDSGYHWLRETPLLFEVFFCGVLITLGCLSIARYIRKRNERASLYLGLFSMMVGTRALLVGERFVYQLDWLSFATLQKLEHTLVYAGLAAFAAYLYELMDGGMPRRAVNTLLAIAGALIALTVLLPIHIGTHTVIPFKLLVVTTALYVIFAYWPLLRARGAGVFWFAASFAILLTTLVVDLINQNTQIQSRPIVHWGMISFVVCQGLFLNQVRHWRKRRLGNNINRKQAVPDAAPEAIKDELDESQRKIEKLELQMQQLRSDLVTKRLEIPNPMLNARIAMSGGASGPAKGSFNETYNNSPESKSVSVEEQRLALVKLLQSSLGLWERYSGKTKVQLAENSQCWRVYIDGTTVKTRTFDKYLKLNSLPSKPRWRLVIRTAYFVLEKAKLPDEEKAPLAQQIEHVQTLFER